MNHMCEAFGPSVDGARMLLVGTLRKVQGIKFSEGLWWIENNKDFTREEKIWLMQHLGYMKGKGVI